MQMSTDDGICDLSTYGTFISCFDKKKLIISESLATASLINLFIIVFINHTTLSLPQFHKKILFRSREFPYCVDR
jgi:hypothetical protein